jgi:hypothetical protein
MFRPRGLEAASVIEPQRWTGRVWKGELAMTSTARREASHDGLPPLRNFAFEFSRMDIDTLGSADILQTSLIHKDFWTQGEYSG